MGLNLHQSCIDHLTNRLAGILNNLIVIKNNFLHSSCFGYLSSLNKSIPEKISSQVELYIGENPLPNFLFGQLTNELIDKFQYDADAPDKKLSDLDCYSNNLEVAKRLIDQFNSLPWNYIFTFKLNSEISRYIIDNEIILSDDIKIIKPTDEVIKDFPLVSGIPNRDNSFLCDGSIFNRHNTWYKNIAYLQIQCSGFVGGYISNNPEYEAIDIFKSILGIFIAVNLFKVNHRPTPLLLKRIRDLVYVHKQNDLWEPIDIIELKEDNISDVLFALGIDNQNEEDDSQKQNEIRNLLKL
jgi:hypothetical protein